MRISDWSSDVCSSDLNPVHAGAAKQAVILSQVSRDGAEMAREQNHGRIESVGLTGVPAILDRGGQRVETGRKRRQARRIERLLESERDIVGHGIGSCLRADRKSTRLNSSH